MPLSRAEFTGLIKDALTHFYSAVHLQSHRLSETWPWQHDSTITRVEAVRQLLVTAIESLRPEHPAVSSSAEGMGYQVLRLRYLEYLSPEEVADSLGIGQTSYYRHHNTAMEALVSLLWDQYSAESATKIQGNRELTAPENEELAPDRAVRFAQEAKRRDVDLEEVLDGVRSTILPLTEKAQVELSIVADAHLPPVHADAVVIRQILLNVLTQVIGLPDANTISIELCNSGAQATLTIRSSAIGALEDHDLAASHGIALGREMAHALGGQLERGERIDTLIISLPSEPSKAILIIDDDRDTANLYSRYLQGVNLSLHVATNRQEC